MSDQDIIHVYNIDENNSNFVLQFVVTVLSIVGANILHKLFP
jgi:hypothetical protein